MAENINRGLGRGSGFQLDKGGVPTESGPFIGLVKNNIDPTRSGRIQVYIETYGGDETDSATWRTLNYLSPFMGVTNQNNRNYGTQGTGDFGNRQSYGMWFSAPDVGTKVLCFFANGDPNQGFYLGSVMEPGIGHMLPAIGATSNYDKTSKWGNNYTKLPVTEINVNDTKISEDPQFYNEDKPIHLVLAGQMFFQGLLRDPLRGPIGSSSHRESPSKVFGFSTPGPAIYADATKVNTLLREGGHSFVMDDGEDDGTDRLVRLRTSLGHQISLIDGRKVVDSEGRVTYPDACIYITHQNGHSWIELGREGTLDVFSTNSVNVRTKGDINLHADNNINLYAGNQLNAFSKNTMKLESTLTSIRSEAELKLYSKLKLVARSDNILALDAEELGSFDGGDSLVFSADCISLNSGAGVPVSAATAIRKNKVADTSRNAEGEWRPEGGKLETINTRVPSHEPWPYHNRGTQNSVDYTGSLTTEFPEFTTEALQTAAQFSPNGIAIDDFTKVDRATVEIGSLNTDQLTGIKAQIAKETGLDYTDFNADIGVGKFGLSPEQLERSGYLTPGTVANYLKDPADTEALLNNTNFWTEKDGISDLPAFLNSKAAQESAVQLTMQDSFSKLRSNGVVKGTESPGDLGGILTGAVRYGADNTVKWAKGQSLDSTTKNGISQSVRDGQFAVAFVDEKVTTTVSSFSSPGGYQNTINDRGVTDTVNNLIDDPRITASTTTTAVTPSLQIASKGTQSDNATLRDLKLTPAQRNKINNIKTTDEAIRELERAYGTVGTPEEEFTEDFVIALAITGKILTLITSAIANEIIRQLLTQVESYKDEDLQGLAQSDKNVVIESFDQAINQIQDEKDANAKFIRAITAAGVKYKTPRAKEVISRMVSAVRTDTADLTKILNRIVLQKRRLL